MGLRDPLTQSSEDHGPSCGCGCQRDLHSYDMDIASLNQTISGVRDPLAAFSYAELEAEAQTNITKLIRGLRVSSARDCLCHFASGHTMFPSHPVKRK